VSTSFTLPHPGASDTGTPLAAPLATSTEIAALQEEICTHLVAAIEATSLTREPFPLIYIEGCFRDSIFQELIANLPEDDFYEPLLHKDALRPDGTSTRSQASLAEKRLHLLPEGRARDLWTAVARAAQDERVKMALLRKLEPGVRERYDQPLEKIEAHSRPALNRDVPGYKILPHPDTRAKVLSGLLYLALAEDQRGLGTSLYTPKISIPGVKRFNLVKTVPFAPNTGVVFAVTRRSFHGREPIPEGCGTRNYFALTYYSDPTRRGY